jgi:hypothetical protein
MVPTWMGYLTPNSSVIRVFISSSPSLALF